MKAGVLIPCYNEEAAVGEVISGVITMIPNVIVVDDGSTDNTAEVVKKTKAEILRHKNNCGKGAALRTGFEYVKNNKDWDALIIMDADGQHDWNEIPKFLEAAKKETIGIVIGNRMNTAKNMPWIRRITNRVTSKVISMKAGQNIPDSQCGYRLIKLKVLKDLLLNTSRFDTESEILIKASHLGYFIDSVPIKSIYRNEKSYICPIRDTIRFIKLIRSFNNVQISRGKEPRN